MREWYEIYRERMNEHYRNHVATKYAKFLETLHEHCGDIMHEIGCGAGNVTRILREMEHTRSWYALSDACPKMLGLAIENNQDINCLFSIGDVRRHVPSNCAVVHSHGLLEHFDDLDILHIVDNMTHAAPIQLHYVPGAKYKTPSRGDERLLEPDYWEWMLQRRFGKRASVSTFNNDLDIILRVEK